MVVTKERLVAEIKSLLSKICEQTKIGPLNTDIKKMLDMMIEADLISDDDLNKLHFIHRKPPR